MVFSGSVEASFSLGICGIIGSIGRHKRFQNSLAITKETGPIVLEPLLFSIDKRAMVRITYGDSLLGI